MLEGGPTRRQLRLRQAALAMVAACLLALTLLASGMLIRSTLEALRYEPVQPVELMALDQSSRWMPHGQRQDAIAVIVPPAPMASPAPVQATVMAATPAPVATAIAASATLTRRPALPVRPTFDGRAIHKVGTVRMLVTAYSPDAKSCGPHAKGITASGFSVWTNAMHLAAADTRYLPFGSLISIPGYHGAEPVPVLDRGSKIKGQHIDVLFPTDGQATAWGKKYLTVTVWDYD